MAEKDVLRYLYLIDRTLVEVRSKKMEFNIKLTLYFEIRDSEIYGGAGSIGYTSFGIELNGINYEKDNLLNQKELMERYILDQTKGMAKFAKVPIECVRVISKEEFEDNTDDD